jgi:Ni/Fe-hydrogenase 1 B-type cytochrome subunit
MAHPVLVTSGEAYEHFAMGRVREVHFIAAFIFTVNFAFRAVWFLLGNSYARTGVPYFWKASWWRALGHQTFLYLQLETGRPHLGHNAVAGLSYTIFIIGLGALQIITGFALYSQSDPGSWLDGLAGWAIPLFGGAFRTLMWHHLFAWGFVVFVILHVYIVVLDSRVFRNGLIGSIADGNKFRRIREFGDVEEDDD